LQKSANKFKMIEEKYFNNYELKMK